MNKLVLLITFVAISYNVQAQNRDFEITVGPEVLSSFHHTPTFYGLGGSVQAEVWVLPALGLGLNTGYYHFSGTGKAPNTSYSAIPLLAVIRYPLPLFDDLYGQDVIGYTFVDNVSFVKSGENVSGALTYYFALGYVLNNHLDISIKVGRPFFGKKDNPVNVNEHNLGFKIAYRL